ncbi:MAG: DUF5684 domain-containing protein [Chitinophagaceae bacterium]
MIETKPLAMDEYQYQSTLSTGALTTLILFCLALGLIVIVSQWKVFTKAGQPGWACIVPIYNIYIMTKIAGKPGWWVLMYFIPFVNFIFAIWLTNMISKSFGKDEGFTVGLILLGIIFWPILGFGSATYQGPFGDPVAYKAYREQHNFDFENRS